MASAGDCSIKSKWKFHVFLSFRGEDTRLGFTDHLYSALQRKSIITFRDNEELQRGEVISRKLIRAIEESLSAIVIISQNYASSTWCLDELLKIIESKHSLGQEVFPVFYGVDPSDVRHQRGIFAEAFRKHEEKFTNDKEKVQKWRDALKEVANLSGWDSKAWPETELIEEIVVQVWTKLESKLPTYSDGLIAIDRRLEDMYSLLLLGMEDVRFIGIWGMGGIGKTTLANVVYKKIKSQFDVSCFLANVRQISGELHGLVQLQSELLSHVKTKGMVIKSSDQGKDDIRNLLHHKKVLLILDDVSAKGQLENLAGNQEWFGPGSRVIVTTRDKHLLISHDVQFHMYETKILNNDESLQLFCKKAFKGDQPEEDYLVLSRNVVKYCGGLPLALEVLGSFLCGRGVKEWEDALDKIKQLSHDDIMNKLRISYDMLEDEYKTIFLDIACFFKGWNKDRVTYILKSCGLHPIIGINVLVEKSLVTCDEGFLGMHDLLEEMGKAIIFQESPNDPSGRSRLWSLENVDQVLTKNKGTEKVQSIVLKSSSNKSYEALWDPEAFSKMSNLRLLIILCDLHLPLGLKCLSSSLKVLIWHRYPLKALALGVQLDELVHLRMYDSKVVQLWNGTQYLRKLKVIDLSFCKELIQIPDISGVPNLENLFLHYCEKLVEVHPSVGQHKKLEILRLMECRSLKILPSKLEISSLTYFSISGCRKVAKLPEFGETMKSLSQLDLLNCKNLICLPNTISNLKSLRYLSLANCSKFSRLPENINENKALEHLDLSRTAIKEVNSSLFHLENLKWLFLSGCRGPVHTSLILPRSVSGLSSLTKLDLSYCNLSDESIPDDLGCLSSLESLVLSGNNFVNLPDHCFANLSKLRFLELEDCPRLQSLPKLPPYVRMFSDLVQNEIEAYLLDPEMLWNLSESRDHKMKDWFYPLHIISGSKLSPLRSMASIMVEIPDYCRSDKWRRFWGIAVGIASEPVNTSPRAHVSWSFVKTQALEPYYPFNLSSTMPVSNAGTLFIFFMSGNYIYIHEHKRGDPNKGELRRRKMRDLITENSKLLFEVKTEGCKLDTKNCWWHVLSEEDVEEMQKMMSVKLRTRKIFGDSFKVEDATAVNAKNEENSNELEEEDSCLLNDSNGGFLSRKLLNISTQGVCLTVMTFVSMMVGFQMFSSPRQALELRTTSHNASDKILQSPKGCSKSYPSTSAVCKSQQQRNRNTTAGQKLRFSGCQVPMRCSRSYHCSYSYFTR